MDFIEAMPTSLFLFGDPPSKTNININYKLKNVPALKIKNPNLRRQKIRWDNANLISDKWVWAVKSFMHIHSLKKINEGYIFLCAEFFFPNNRRKDLDNVTKLFLDVFKKADFIEDDSQISTLLTFKEVNKAKPGILIHSLAYSPTRSARIEWLQLMLQKLEKK